MGKLLTQIQRIVQNQSNDVAIVRLLKAASVLIFVSRAWQHMVWNEALTKSILNILEQPGADTENIIQKLLPVLGATYILCVFSSLKIKKLYSIHSGILIWGGANLLLLNYIDFLNKSQTLGIFIEHTIQWITPFLLLLNFKLSAKTFLPLLKISVVLTFVGHGLFALGYYDVPGHFIAMVTKLTPIEGLAGALVFLKIAGIMDVILSIGIFIPKMRLFFLWYATVWGLLTALARYGAFFDFHLILSSTGAWLHETILRLPHSIIPFICILIILKTKKNLAP